MTGRGKKPGKSCFPFIPDKDRLSHCLICRFLPIFPEMTDCIEFDAIFR